ncbi:MAG: T9SS type A sorting domain-containing protein, partial [Candidatus Aegiribacteria sp.]|nr:T9SS type A sorting domain-containing protein [Candidatus Aegiribacteria sp.]
YHLSYGSPCIDAGNPDWEYNDPEDPFNPGYALWPAMGTTRNDMGAFGGGAVNYWLSVEEEESSPAETNLILTSFPNPFSTSCTVCYQLVETSQVNLSVFDLSGRLVENLVDEVVPAGMYSEYLDGSGLCSGMYLIRLVAGEISTSRRCIVIR